LIRTKGKEAGGKIDAPSNHLSNEWTEGNEHESWGSTPVTPTQDWTNCHIEPKVAQCRNK